MDIFEQILNRYWGYTSFRSVQREVIESVFNGTDTLALMPTGGGKSITFQVPALAKDGICLVITPLIALMKDQVDNLKRRGISAEAIHSGLSTHEMDILLDNCAYGNIKFLYLSPERIATDLFAERVKKFNVNMVAVDESHCISQWGYDFRPSYLQIANLRQILPQGVPFLALTATATPQVVDDIQEKLGFVNGHVVRMSFMRDNLVYLVRNVEDKAKYLLKVVNGIPGSGIVYVRNRQKTNEIAQMLKKEGIAADFYNAGLTMEMRNLKQTEWQNGTTRIIVATNAFGMGIDKPDVRLVVHMDLPDSPEAYFQEAGRAGRDQKLAYGVLLYNEGDAQKIEQRIATTFPPVDEIKHTYQALGSYLNVAIGAGKGMTFNFNLMDFCSSYHLNSTKAYNSLKILEREGYIEMTEEIDNPSRLMFIVKKDTLYAYQVKHASMDRFIKILLRNYTGVFTQYTKIDEAYIGKLAALSRDEVYNTLITLSKHGIIKYIPRKRSPLLILTEERLDEKNLRIEPRTYGELRSRFVNKANSMLLYAQSTNKCRSQILLEYFGQSGSPRCGKCDVCTSSTQHEMSKDEFDAILSIIKEKLLEKTATEEELIDSIKKKPELIIKVITFMRDNGKIIKNPKGQLEWCG